MKIVFASHTAMNPHMVVGSHQLARVYAREGHQVLHLSLPFSTLHLMRLHRPRMATRLVQAVRGPHQVEPGLTQWTPRAWIPWDLWKTKLERTTADTVVRNQTLPSTRKIRSVLNRCGMRSVDIAMIDDPRMVGIETILKAKTSIYRATDLYAKFRNDPPILRAEERLTRSADHLVATSPAVADHLRQISGGRNVRVFRNGFDDRHFAKPMSIHPTLDHSAIPRVAYIGAIDDRFDLASVMALATSRPQLSIYLYGPVTIARPTKSPPNIHWMGSLRYDDLPAVLGHCQIAILPFLNTETNHGRSPMKLYEYLAAGCRVVGYKTRTVADLTETPNTHWYDDDSPTALIAAMDRALAAGPASPDAALVTTYPTWQSIAGSLIGLAKTPHLETEPS